MFVFFGAIFIGGVIGYASERFGLTRLGYIVAIAVGVGGAMIFSIAQYMFGLGFGLSRGMTSVVGSAIFLFVANMRR